MEKQLRWMRLDNAAKIYPAVRRRNWSNVFRQSATLTEDIDKGVLSSALVVVVKRFPTIAARLRKGAFWYYLQEVEEVPEIMDEYSYPLTYMSKAEKFNAAISLVEMNEYDEAIEVLLALGYKNNEVEKVMSKLANEKLDTNGYVKKALSMIVNL